MSNPNAGAIDLAKLSPPSAAAPGTEVAKPQSAKDAHRTIEGALKAHRSRVDSARKALGQAEKQYATRVQQAKLQAQQAGVPNKLGSIGVIQRVTLTETTLKTPKGEYKLSPAVQARAEQHGNKQVVQGWVFKSDNDRREVYLHVDGPDWGVVVPFSMKHSIVQPRELHAFAKQIALAARGVEKAKAGIESRRVAAQRQLAAALGERGAVEQAANAYVAVAQDTQDVEIAARNADAFLADADMADRKVRKATEALGSASPQVAAWAEEATQARNRVRQESANAHSEAERLSSRLTEVRTRVASPLRSPAEVASPPAEIATGKPDVFDQIHKLGELRDAGLVTPEEFEAKKADLLGRL
jgi:Short C-terminal domain